MRFRRATLLWCLLLCCTCVAQAEPTRALYFYETRTVTLCEWQELLDEASAAGYRRIFLNLDEGNGFLLDDAGSRQKIAEMARRAQARHVELDALMLQDTRWLKDWAEAGGRVARLEAFVRENPRAFSGLHIDVEPHAQSSWEKASANERRALLRELAFLLGRIREQIKRSKPRLRFSAALPWWFTAEKDDVVRASLHEIDRPLDELVLMAYDEPGKKLFGEDTATLADSLQLHRFLKRLKRGHAARVALATYDFASAESLARTAAALEDRYTREKRFAGVAIFHHNGRYAMEVARSLSGLVLDASTGEPVAGATVEIVGQNFQAISSRCGAFRLRRLEGEQLTIEIRQEGYETASVAVALLAPGRETILSPTPLRPAPKASASTTPE